MIEEMCLILSLSYLLALPMLRWTLSMDCGSLSNSCFILRCDAVLLGSGCAGEANLRFRVRSWLSPSEVEVVEADGAVEGDGEGAIMIDGEACFVDESRIELYPSNTRLENKYSKNYRVFTMFSYSQVISSSIEFSSQKS